MKRCEVSHYSHETVKCAVPSRRPFYLTTTLTNMPQWRSTWRPRGARGVTCPVRGTVDAFLLSGRRVECAPSPSSNYPLSDSHGVELRAQTPREEWTGWRGWLYWLGNSEKMLLSLAKCTVSLWRFFVKALGAHLHASISSSPITSDESHPHTLTHSRIKQSQCSSHPLHPLEALVLLGFFCTHTRSIWTPSFYTIGNPWEDVCAKRLTPTISLPP